MPKSSIFLKRKCKAAINEAEGVAKEIEALAEATAISIEKVADALNAPMGTEAMAASISRKISRKIERISTRRQ